MSNPEKPEWASFFSPEVYADFLQEIRGYFEANKLKYALADGELNVMDGDFGGIVIGLANLAQVCHQSDRADWKNLVASHFDGLKGATATQHDFSAKAHDINFAQAHLGVKLYNKVRCFLWAIGQTSKKVSMFM